MTIQKYENQTGITFGQEHMDATDFIPPRVKVVQAMSQEAADGKAVVGEFFNTLTGENYGKTLRFIPLTTFKNRILIVRPERRDGINAILSAHRDPAKSAKTVEGDGLQCRSLDMIEGIGSPGGLCVACPLSVWEGNTPPTCTESYNVTAMNELGDLIILSFSKSAAKTGKRMISMMRMRREKPWSLIYLASTRIEKNDRGTFAVPEVMATAERTDDSLLRVAQQWIGELTGRVIDIAEEYSDETAAPPEGDTPF